MPAGRLAAAAGLLRPCRQVLGPQVVFPPAALVVEGMERTLRALRRQARGHSESVGMFNRPSPHRRAACVT